MAFTPGRAATSLAFSTASCVELEVAPATMGTRPGRDFDGGIDDVQPFVVSEGRSLAGGAAGNKKIDAGLDLPRDQIAQGRVVDGTILMKRSYKCSATATELHR